MKKRILFTGGGSAGHVMVNLALIPTFIEDGWTIDYIGSISGIEKKLISPINEVRYHSISTGKLRRYFDWNNVKDPFRIVKGVLQAYQIIKKRKPEVIFSKGGFVSVPVILGAWLNRVPTLIHESDITPGLANKISIPFATKVCVTFPETAEHFRSDKAVHVGAIVRDELKQGNKTQGLTFCDFTKTKPVILIMGGSLGAQRMNEVVRESLPKLLESFQMVHICGKGNVDATINVQGYQQFEYVNEELPDILAMTDMVISRAGANAIFEFLALRKPMILIPLPKESSRGDQILNAQSFEKLGYGEVLPQEDMTGESLLETIDKMYENRSSYIRTMEKNEEVNAVQKVVQMIQAVAE